MFAKIIVLIIMFLILISLFSALIFLVKDKENSKRTVKALTFRIGLSLTLFFLLFLGFSLGLISPHNIVP